ncbi:hypothetical protein V8G54_000369 [Vigna mungo]|uniref:Calcineurin B-like protein n=1 Tax=Vigna mungo TaxID=3915 RepID=A0AAQ3P552_VIGMU
MEFPQTGVSLRSSLTIGETLCAVFIPLIGLVEALVFSLAGCFDFHSPAKKKKPSSTTFEDILALAKGSPCSFFFLISFSAVFVYFDGEMAFKVSDLCVAVTVNEIEALHELFKKLSNSIFEDGLIHKEELTLALLKTTTKENLFLDRVFDVFDEKRNGVIEFDEFVHALSIFHPCTSLEKKIDFSFRMYDLRQTGYIEREEVRQMVVAILSECSIDIKDEALDSIIDKTFEEADTDKDDKISKEEWKTFVTRRPTLLKHMTLPDLA